MRGLSGTTSGEAGEGTQPEEATSAQAWGLHTGWPTGSKDGVVPFVGQKGRQRPDGNESERCAKALNLTLKVMTCKREYYDRLGFSPKDSFSCNVGDRTEMGQVQRHGDQWEGFCHHLT